SPVIARRLRIGRPLSKLTSAVTIAAPADGPSFGTAPEGTWMWMSCLRKKSGSIPYFSALDRTHVSAAVMDSCITSPRCPVVVNCFPPRIRLASMNTMSPPTGVHTNPTATPGCFTRSSISFSVRNLGSPRNWIHPVCRGDEHHLGQIERNVQVVIAERSVLLRIENFHQRRRGITAEIPPELINFVQHAYGVVRFRSLQSLNNLSRQRADIRP